MKLNYCSSQSSKLLFFMVYLDINISLQLMRDLALRVFTDSMFEYYKDVGMF